MSPRARRDREAPTQIAAPTAVEHAEVVVALGIIDRSLATFADRTLIARHEVVDHLLDLRNTLLTGPPTRTRAA